MNRGLIKLIILIIVVAVILGYFGINLESIWRSEPVQKNLGFLWNSAKYIWIEYLAKPTNFIWGVFYNYIWLSFIENLERLKAGQNPTFMDNLPSL